VDQHALHSYLSECRELTLAELRRIVPRRASAGRLYELMLDYPERSAKALRPALCIASNRALGGRIEDCLPSAAVLELFHNAFLIHDDIEDGSLLRRGRPTLHIEHGVPVAVNVGDAMLALALGPLLDNTRMVGLGKSLRVLQLVSRMVRESVEGQAIELDWIEAGEWRLRMNDYWRMVYKKTCWYTFIAPVCIGAILAGATLRQIAEVRRFATFLGVAFQIMDDVLNLDADVAAYGKEIGGDLWEGKRTLILIEAMERSSETDRRNATRRLSRTREERSNEDVTWLLDWVRRSGGIDAARSRANDLASKAQRFRGAMSPWLGGSVHRDFLDALTRYVVERDR